MEIGDAISTGLDSEARDYWEEHRRRIVAAMVRAGALIEGPLAGRRPVRVLDVGPSFEVMLLAKLFPAARLETMGFADDRYKPAGLAAHHPVDLNETADLARCARVEPCDLMLFLEVIEHLRTAPVHVLRYLRECLVPGGWLILSTPNAAWLRNRWRLLCGQNPFEMIRQDARSPGHFREYTRAEMTAQLEHAGFEIVEVRLENHYDFGSESGRRFTRLAASLPTTFRHDMMFVARRQ